MMEKSGKHLLQLVNESSAFILDSYLSWTGWTGGHPVQLHSVFKYKKSIFKDRKKLA